MSRPRAEIDLRDRIIRLARYWDEQSVEPAEDFADALLELIGLERVPNLAISVTDEHVSGVPFGVHRRIGEGFCGDESICARHEPVYRLNPPPTPNPKGTP